jgi:triphosphoribosyl-dephospho-CoA synthetase
MTATGAWGNPANYSDLTAEAEEAVREAGIYSDYGALAELESSLSLTANTMLTSKSPLLRALAVLDSRVGKRRLQLLANNPDENELVRSLLTLRCEAESVRLRPCAG